MTIDSADKLDLGTLGASLTEEQAREIFARGEEAVVFALLDQAKATRPRPDQNDSNHTIRLHNNRPITTTTKTKIRFRWLKCYVFFYSSNNCPKFVDLLHNDRRGFITPNTTPIFYSSAMSSDFGLMRCGPPFHEDLFINALSSSIGMGNTIVVLFSAPTSDNVCKNRICIAIGWPSSVSAASFKRPDA